MSDITVTRRSAGHAEVIAVAGEIDIATYRQLRGALIKAVDEGPGSVIVDMSGVEWIDSTGLGTLVGAFKRARAKGGTVQVAGAPGRIAKHFQVTGLSKLFGMHASAEAALAITAGAGLSTATTSASSARTTSAGLRYRIEAAEGALCGGHRNGSAGRSRDERHW